MLFRYLRHFTVNLSAYRFCLAYGTKRKSKRKQTKKFGRFLGVRQLLGHLTTCHF